MAQTFAIRQIQLYKGPYLTPTDEERGGAEEGYYKETAGQTFKVSDLVYLDSNGTVAICTTAASPGKLNSPILGLAQQAATGVTGNPVRVRVISRNDRFLMNYFHSTAASSVIAQTSLRPDVAFGIYMGTAAINYAGGTGTGGFWVVDGINTSPETGGTLARVQIVGFLLSPDSAPLSSGSYGQPAIGDINPPVIVRFLDYSIQSDGSAHVINLQG